MRRSESGSTDPEMSRSETAASGRSAPQRATGRGFNVALVGPDGAGKSTIAREVIRRLPMPASYLYMGVNLEASTAMLPTTRLALAFKRRRGGGSDMTARQSGPHLVRGPVADARSLLRMINWLAEEAYRQVLAARIRRRGEIAVLDRDFFCDYHASAIAGPATNRPLDIRLHGLVLRRWYRRPDLTIMLDAPPEILLARKGQDNIAGLTRRRQEYLDLAAVLPAFVTIDADRPLDVVSDDVVASILAYVAERSPVAGSGSGDAAAAAPAATSGPTVEAPDILVGAPEILDERAALVGP
jgi:thymidylate kinase